MNDNEHGILSPPVSIAHERWDEYADFPEYLNCGSLHCLLPAGIRCDFEIDRHINLTAEPDSPLNMEVYLIHYTVPGILGECILSAYASPTGKNSWSTLLHDYASQLRAQGVAVNIVNGMWDQELIAEYGSYELRIIGVQGDRWILRGVLYSLSHSQDEADSQVFSWLDMAYTLMSNTRIYRGTAPMPMFSALPLKLPDQALEHINTYLNEREADQNPSLPELVTSYLHSSQHNKTISQGFLQIIQEYMQEF